MRTRTAFMVAAVLLLTVSTPSRAAAASAPHLMVAPAQGHAGDPIFLSGSGFAPHLPVSIWLQCGTTERVVTTIRANALGRFVGFRLRLPNHNRSGTCAFWGASQPTPSVRSRPIPYAFVPHGHSLTRCAIQMCLHVQAFLVRLKSGARGSVVVSGWPGAVVHVTIARTEHGAKSRVIYLNWRGVGSLSTPIAPGLLKGLQARVFVYAQLGHISGRGEARFHVMFGNR